MNVNIDHILIFKTNIRTEKDRHAIMQSLNTHAQIQTWSIDLHDVDCVLRVISDSLDHDQVISLIGRHGFECSELL